MGKDARQIANWFIQRANKDGRNLTIMSLLKLCYFSQGWHLEMFNIPLFHNRIEAWKFGPVIPDVYFAFRDQRMSLTRTLSGYSNVVDEQEIQFLENIYNLYGNMSSYKMSGLTHVRGGPWDLTQRMSGLYSEIPNDLIKLHYIEKRQKVLSEESTSS